MRKYLELTQLGRFHRPHNGLHKTMIRGIRKETVSMMKVINLCWRALHTSLHFPDASERILASRYEDSIYLCNIRMLEIVGNLEERWFGVGQTI